MGCDKRMYTELFPDGLDGLPFEPRDLQTAMRWMQTHPCADLRLTTTGISGIIEIYPTGASLPRWCLWQTRDGRLQLDDVAQSDFALPYPTLDMALRFVALNLAKLG
jgi:hypothetical protein